MKAKQSLSSTTNCDLTFSENPKQMAHIKRYLATLHRQ